jgi:hypothetical protein
MARPGWPERNRAARSFRQLRRFHHVITQIRFSVHTGAGTPWKCNDGDEPDITEVIEEKKKLH